MQGYLRVEYISMTRYSLYYTTHLIFCSTNEEEDYTRPKKKKKLSGEPSAPKYESPRIRCCCDKHHNGHFRGNCPTNCKDEETGVQYEIGECPTCQCPCNKVTLACNVNKVLNQSKMSSRSSEIARRYVAAETAQYLQSGEKIRHKAKKQLKASYKSDSKRLSKSAQKSFKKALENHGSYSKARHIVTNPPSKEVRAHLAKKFEVLLCLDTLHFRIFFNTSLSIVL